MLHIIRMIVVGFVIGLLARFFYPGAVHLGWIASTVLGIAGSFVGGLLANLFSKPAPGQAFHPAGFLMSVLGAMVLIFVCRSVLHIV